MMALFGFGKKKTETRNNFSAGSALESEMNTELYKKITSNIAILLMKMHVTSEPFMMSVESDSGIFEGFYRNHLTNPNFLALKNRSADIYIKMCGMHMLGSGMYICYMQEKLKKGADEFTLDEVKSIGLAWQSKDAYELALNTYGIPIQSQQKAALDQIYVMGLGIYKQSVGNAWDKKENLRAYMKVMYNAGFTVGISEMSRKG